MAILRRSELIPGAKPQGLTGFCTRLDPGSRENPMGFRLVELGLRQRHRGNPDPQSSLSGEGTVSLTWAPGSVEPGQPESLGWMASAAAQRQEAIVSATYVLVL